VQIQQRVQLHCPFAFAAASPRKQGQAQIDGSGVQRVSAVLEALAAGFAGIELAGAGDEDLREAGEDAPSWRPLASARVERETRPRMPM